MHVMRNRQGSVALCTGPACGIFGMRCITLALTQGCTIFFGGPMLLMEHSSFMQDSACFSMRGLITALGSTLNGILCKRVIQSAMRR